MHTSNIRADIALLDQLRDVHGSDLLLRLVAAGFVADTCDTYKGEADEAGLVLADLADPEAFDDWTQDLAGSARAYVPTSL